MAAPILTAKTGVWVYVGGTLLPKDLVTVTDDTDTNPTLTFKTQPNFSTVGTVSVTVVATDKDGEKAEKAVSVEVKAQPGVWDNYNPNKPTPEQLKSSEEMSYVWRQKGMRK